MVCEVAILSYFLKLGNLFEAAFLHSPYSPVIWAGGTNLLPILWIERYFRDFLMIEVIRRYQFILCLPIINESFGIQILIAENNRQIFVIAAETQRNDVLLRLIVFLACFVFIVA